MGVAAVSDRSQPNMWCLAVDQAGKLQLNPQQIADVGTGWRSIGDRLMATGCAPTAQIRLDDGRLEVWASVIEASWDACTSRTRVPASSRR